MANEKQQCCEKFKTMIGGQALIEGILMRGPRKDAIAVRGTEGIHLEVMPRKLNPPKSAKSWPFIRGVFNFFDAQVMGVKMLLKSADLAPEEYSEEPSKFDRWLEKKLGGEKAMSFFTTLAVILGIGMSVGLFFLLLFCLCKHGFDCLLQHFSGQLCSLDRERNHFFVDFVLQCLPSSFPGSDSVRVARRFWA